MTTNAKAANKTMSGLDGLGWPNPEDEPKPKKTMNSQLEIKLATTPETDDATLIALDIECGGKFEAVHVQVSKRLERERNELREWASVNGVSSLAKDRDQFRARLREEQQLHVQTLNERDEAQERADTMFAKHVDILDQTRNEREEWKAKYIQQNKDLGCEMMDPNGTIWDYAKKMQRELTVVTKQRDNFEDRLRVELGGHPDSELWGDAGLIAATMRCVDALDAVTEQRDRLAEALIKCREDSVCEQVRMEKCRYTKAADESQANIDRADKALQYLKQPTKP